jgi:glutamate carboxypeptidase
MSSTEREIVERARAEPMREQVLAWSAINSGSRNLEGLAGMAATLADAFSALPGELSLDTPAPVEAVNAHGLTVQIEHGRHLHLTVRPKAPVQLLFTGHMDTVYAADHHFQDTRWIEDGVLNGPGVADMKGGLAVMLAALKAVETSGAASALGYEIVINSDEEVGSLSSAPLLARAAAGETGRAHLRARGPARRDSRGCEAGERQLRPGRAGAIGPRRAQSRRGPQRCASAAIPGAATE